MTNVTEHLPVPGMKVRLTLTSNNLRASACRQAAEIAFGPKIREHFACARDVQVVCRPDQFTIFMVERNRLGGCNSYKDLDVRLIDAPAFLQPRLDVTEHVYG